MHVGLGRLAVAHLVNVNDDYLGWRAATHRHRALFWNTGGAAAQLAYTSGLL